MNTTIAGLGIQWDAATRKWVSLSKPTPAPATTTPPAESNLASIQDDWGFEQPNLPETKTNYSVAPVAALNDNAAFQADARTLLYAVAAVIGILLLIRTLKHTHLI